MAMPAGRHAATVVAAVVGYTALVVWLTWPLASLLTVRLPCAGSLVCGYDTVYSAWAASWVSHALLTLSPIGAANIYYPAPDSLFYGPAALGVVPYALPVFAATGNASAAINVAFLICAVSTALALHWVVWRWTGSHLAGFVAAWAFLMNRWFLWGFVAVTPHLSAIQYLPLIVYLAARPLERWQPAVLLCLLITIQCLTDPVYVAAAVLAPLGVLALVRLVRRAWRPSGLRLLAVLVGAIVGLVPVLYAYARVRARDPGFAGQSLWAFFPQFFRPFAGVVPTDLTTLWWSGDRPITMAPAMLGLIGLGSVIGLARRKLCAGSGLGLAWRHAGLWAVVGTWVSLSPIATIGKPFHGEWRILLPHYLLIPSGFYEVVRMPERLGVAGMIGLCLLAGVAFAELVRALDALRISRRWTGVLATVTAATVVALAYRIPPGGHKAIPDRYLMMPTPATDEETLRALRAGQGPVLEVPAFGPRSKRPEPLWHALAMYRSTLHWRPLLNGYSSYWPAGFYERMQLTQLLPATSALRRLVCETGVRTIVVDRLAPSANRETWSRAVLEPPKGLRCVAATPAMLVFDVTIPLPGEPGGPDCAASADAVTPVG
jgi:hypothetical protein